MKSLRLSEEDLRAILKRQRSVRTHRMDGVDIDKIHSNPKYKNRRTKVDGFTFDSQREANRYSELKLLQEAGEIHDLDWQVRFDLRVKNHLVCSYIADFTYRKKDDPKLVVEDAKGMKTRVYIIKKKLMLACHDIEILET